MYEFKHELCAEDGGYLLLVCFYSVFGFFLSPSKCLAFFWHAVYLKEPDSH